MESNSTQSKTNIVQQIFLEEHFVGKSQIDEPAIYLSRDNYLNLENLLGVIENFFGFPFPEQAAYLKVLPQILNTLTIFHLPNFLDKIYNPAVDRSFIQKNFEIYLLLLENSALVTNFLITSRFLVSKRNTIDAPERRPTKKASIGTGIFSGNLDEPFKMKVLEIVVKMLECNFGKKEDRVVDAIGQFSDSLNQFENENKLLFVVLSMLHDPSQKVKVTTALKLLKRIVINCSAPYVEGFVAIDIISLIQNGDLEKRRAAYACFMSMLAIFRPEFLHKKFADILASMINHSETEIRLIFLDHLQLVTEKMKLDFVKEKILPVYQLMLSSKEQVIREQSLLRISDFLIAFLSKMEQMFNPKLDMLNEILAIYFNLHALTDKMGSKFRIKIINENYGKLAGVMRIFAKRLWSHLRSLILRLDDYSNISIIETTKLALAKQFGLVANVVGIEIVEKDLIVLIDQKFLTLGPKTSQAVKLRTIERLASVLKNTSPTTRKYFVDYYISIQDDTKKWRIRASIAGQLEDLLEIFEPMDVVSFIIPMFFVFCKDECAVVRKLAASRFHLLVQCLRKKNEPHLFIALENMRDFATRPKFYLRQVYITLFESLFWHCPEEIDNEMKKLLMGLLDDKVANVKIRLAIFWEESRERQIMNPLLSELWDQLGKCKDYDIQKILQRSLTESLKEVQSSGNAKLGTENEADAHESVPRLIAIDLL